MINILNGIKNKYQEIEYLENKESALEVLLSHNFKIGELFAIGYYYKRDSEIKDIILALGIDEGTGPDKYRIIADRGVIVVTAVLPSIPDVKAVALFQIYLARDHEDDNNLYFLRRYQVDEDGKTAEIEKRKALEKSIIIDASTGDIYLLNPPKGLVNLFDLLIKPQLKDVHKKGTDVSVDIEYNGDLFEDLFFLTEAEKKHISNQVFEGNLELTITSTKYTSSGSTTTSNDPCEVAKVIYTLVAKYKGDVVKLTTTPEGWTYNSATTSYTKEIVGNKTSYSGDPVCQYDGNSKIAKGIYTEIGKRFFMISLKEKPTTDDIIVEGRDYLVSDSPKGYYKLYPKENSYMWFLFPPDMLPEAITELGLDYVQGSTTTLDNVTWKNTNLGTYVVYKSLLPQNKTYQNIVIY